MLRVIVPTVYCRDPLDELFTSPWSQLHCRRQFCNRRRAGSSLMAYPNLAAFLDAMEATETTSGENCDKTCTRCSCKKSPESAQDSPVDDSARTSEPKDPQSASASTESKQSSAPSTSANQPSKATKPSKAVTVPVKRSRSDSDHFKVSLNVKSFQPDNIEVTHVDNELKVHAKEEVERYGIVFHREIHRSYHLPKDVDVETLKSTLSNAGVLTIEAQRRSTSSRDFKHQRKENPDNAKAPSEDSTTDVNAEEERPTSAENIEHHNEHTDSEDQKNADIPSGKSTTAADEKGSTTEQSATTSETMKEEKMEDTSEDKEVDEDRQEE